jgi:hypothetical protein
MAYDLLRGHAGVSYLVSASLVISYSRYTVLDSPQEYAIIQATRNKSSKHERIAETNFLATTVAAHCRELHKRAQKCKGRGNYTETTSNQILFAKEGRP